MRAAASMSFGAAGGGGGGGRLAFRSDEQERARARAIRQTANLRRGQGQPLMPTPFERLLDAQAEEMIASMARIKERRASMEPTRPECDGGHEPAPPTASRTATTRPRNAPQGSSTTSVSPRRTAASRNGPSAAASPRRVATGTTPRASDPTNTRTTAAEMRAARLWQRSVELSDAAPPSACRSAGAPVKRSTSVERKPRMAPSLSANDDSLADDEYSERPTSSMRRAAGGGSAARRAEAAAPSTEFRPDERGAAASCATSGRTAAADSGGRLECNGSRGGGAPMTSPRCTALPARKAAESGARLDSTGRALRHLVLGGGHALPPALVASWRAGEFCDAEVRRDSTLAHPPTYPNPNPNPNPHNITARSHEPTPTRRDRRCAATGASSARTASS